MTTLIDPAQARSLFRDIFNEHVAAGSNFSDEDIEQMPVSEQFAEAWLQAVPPRRLEADEFLASVKRASDRYGLTYKQVRAVCNTALRDARAIAGNSVTSAKPRQAAGVRGADVSRGTYTVVFSDASRSTVRIEHVGDGEFAGWTFARHLVGPQNESDYQNFAFAKPGETFQPKRGYTVTSPPFKALLALAAASDSARAEMGVTWARESGACYICHRLLTTPESIERGIGPKCAAGGF